MIKNLVFDLGNVLVEFKPADYLKRIGLEEKDIDSLVKIIFKDKRWNEFDRGSFTIEEYATQLKKEWPQYKNHIETIFDGNWPPKLFRPKEAAIAFLKEYSKQYDIYVLSNVSQYVLEYIETLDFFENVKSGTYSYKIKFTKPEPEIYTAFFKENDVKPEECLFLDDWTWFVL